MLHAATPSELHAAVDGRWTPGLAGSDGTRSWFVEPDRWFELTAVAFDDDVPTSPLWTPPACPPDVPGRCEVRDLLRAAARDDITGADIWAAAVELGDPLDPATRRRAMWLCVRGKEPPMG